MQMWRKVHLNPVGRTGRVNVWSYRVVPMPVGLFVTKACLVVVSVCSEMTDEGIATYAGLMLLNNSGHVEDCDSGGKGVAATFEHV